MLDLADFIWQARPGDDLMAVVSQAWYNGRYPMTAKPIKILELHRPIHPVFNNKHLENLQSDLLHKCILI